MIAADVLTYYRDEDGQPAPGWRRVRADRAFNFKEDTIRDGLDALQVLPAGAQRDAVRAWVTKHADTLSPLPPGTYPLVGKRAIVVLEASHSNLESVRAQSDWARSVARATTGPAQTTARKSTSSTKSTASAAVAKARAALRS